MKHCIRITFLGVFALCACSLADQEPQDAQIIQVGCKLIIPGDRSVYVPANGKLLIGGSDCHE